MNNLKGFYKVGENLGSLYKVIMYSPSTGESKSIVVDDRDYPVGGGLIDREYSLDTLNFLKYLEIDKDVEREYLHTLGIIQEGDLVEIVSGRKSKGYKGVVTKTYSYEVYSQSIPYAILDNRIKVQEKHLKLVESVS